MLVDGLPNLFHHMAPLVRASLAAHEGRGSDDTKEDRTMKYLQKSFSLSMTPTKEGKPRSGTKTFIYCTKCEKVHEKGTKHAKR